METKAQQWRILFDGREVYHVKSKKGCIQIIVLAIFFLSLPILSLVLTLLFAPCFLLGKRGWQCAIYNLEPQSKGKITSKLCESMGEYLAVPLIHAINKEREKAGKHSIPSADDMCATALFKGLVQMEANGVKECGLKSNLHDWPSRGVTEVLKIKARDRVSLPAKLSNICNYDKPGVWKKPDEILGRSLIGHCYGCSGSSSGFENSHWGRIRGRGACLHSEDLVSNAVNGWLNSPGHRRTMLSQGEWSSFKWTRLGAAIMTRCNNNGTSKEEFQYWANSWFSNLP